MSAIDVNFNSISANSLIAETETASDPSRANATSVSKGVLSNKQLHNLSRKSGSIWECIEQIKLTTGGSVFKFRCRQEVDYVTTGTEEEKAEKMATFARLQADIFPAAVPFPDEISRLFKTPPYYDLDYTTEFNELGCESFQNENGVFFQFPNKKALDSLWKKFCENHPELKLPSFLAIAEVLGIATDEEYTQMLLSHLAVLSPDDEFTHDWPNHLVIIIISIIACAKAGKFDYLEFNHNLNETFGLFCKAVDFFVEDHSLDHLFSSLDNSLTKNEMIRISRTFISAAQDAISGEPLYQHQDGSFDVITSLFIDNDTLPLPFKGSVKFARCAQLAKSITSLWEDERWKNYFHKRHQRVFDVNLLNIFNTIIYTYFKAHGAEYGGNTFVNYEESIGKVFPSPYNPSLTPLTLTDEEMNAAFLSGTYLFI